MEYFCRATSDALTVRDKSMGNYGGTTEVMIMIQSRRSFDFLRPRSIPDGSLVPTGSPSTRCFHEDTVAHPRCDRHHKRV
jgi:hypothetical protein